MKIATYRSDAGAATGVIQGDRIIDLASCGFAGNMKELLKNGIDVAAISAKLDSGDARSLSETELLAPVPNPGKVLAIGLNYGDHIEESGMEAPKHQVWFNKR